MLIILSFSNRADPSYAGNQVPSLSPDNSVFVYLAKLYSNAHKEMHKGRALGCDDNFPGGITNGADWYNVEGEEMLRHEGNLLSI